MTNGNEVSRRNLRQTGQQKESHIVQKIKIGQGHENKLKWQSWRWLDDKGGRSGRGTRFYYFALRDAEFLKQQQKYKVEI